MFPKLLQCILLSLTLSASALEKDLKAWYPMNGNFNDDPPFSWTPQDAHIRSQSIFPDGNPPFFRLMSRKRAYGGKDMSKL